MEGGWRWGDFFSASAIPDIFPGANRRANSGRSFHLYFANRNALRFFMLIFQRETDRLLLVSFRRSLLIAATKSANCDVTVRAFALRLRFKVVKFSSSKREMRLPKKSPSGTRRIVARSRAAFRFASGARM